MVPSSQADQQGLSDPTHSTEQKEERLKDMAITAFLMSSDHLLDRLLSDDEWCQFVLRSDALLDELGKLKVVQPPRNPTTQLEKKAEEEWPAKFHSYQDQERQYSAICP